MTRKGAILPLFCLWLAITGLLIDCGGKTPAGAPAVPATRERLVFAETEDFWTAPTLLAGILDLYKQVGLDVRVAKFPSGLAAKNAVVTGGADLGLVATTPLAIAGFQKEQLALFVTYFESDSVIKLVGRAGKGTITPAFLPRHRVGYIPGTISQITLERLLEKYRIAPSSIVKANFRPPELIPALRRGDIDAFVAWEPFPLQAKRDIPDVSEFLDRNLYTVQLHLVSRPKVIAAKRGALVKFLSALRLAEERIANDPDGSRAQIEKSLGFRPGELAAIWPNLRFTLKLDKPALLRDLKTEGRWALASGIVKGEIPDYNYMLRDEVLKAFQAQERR